MSKTKTDLKFSEDLEDLQNLKELLIDGNHLNLDTTKNLGRISNLIKLDLKNTNLISNPKNL
jgi:hypothetical protein